MMENRISDLIKNVSMLKGKRKNDMFLQQVF